MSTPWWSPRRRQAIGLEPRAAGPVVSARKRWRQGQRRRLYASAIRFPPRPLGTVAKKCLVRANHFLVDVGDKDFHHHDVSVEPVVHNKKTNREILGVLVKQYWESHLGRRRPAYDGRKSLYTAGPLPFNNKAFPVKLVENDEAAGSNSQSRRKEREFKVTISMVARIDLNHLQQFIQGRQLDCLQEIMQVLGELGDGLEYWRGYCQSLKPTHSGLSLNIDVSARAFYKPILVAEFVAKRFNRQDMSTPLSNQDHITVKKALRGIRVEITYTGYRESYKIIGSSNKSTSQTN